MDARDWERLKELYGRARRLPASERAAFLERACGSDSVLRAELEALLGAEAGAESFFGRLSRAVPPLPHAPPVDSPPPPFPPVPGAEPWPDPLLGRTVRQYRIESRLGAGGMGVVYRAHDTSLDRPVALKFLPPHVGAEEAAAERFLVEARAAAALDHPNVCAVHEIGQTEAGRRFLVMACYEGETLREKLARGPLPVEEAADYARQTGAALAAAHARGIVHRDIKPGNVLVTPQGTVKVLDFGLAKLSDVTLTGAGRALGTVAYMAPEQLRGEPVDARADLWALGVLWYEMLAGRRPFPGEDTAAVAHRIQHEEPPPVTDLRPEVPAETTALLSRLLAKDPDHRPPGADAVLLPKGWRARRADGASKVLSRIPASKGARATLASAVVVPVLAALGYGAGVLVDPGARAGGTAPPARSVAVLPFENLSGNPEHASFAEAMTEEVTSALTEVPGLLVKSRNSASTFPESGMTVTEFADAIGVAHVIEGSVQRSGDRVHITVQLIDGRTDGHVWSETYDRRLTDMVEVQAEVARQVTSRLAASFTERERERILARATEDPVAYDLWLQVEAGSEDLDRRIELLRRATARDSAFWPAWERLAYLYMGKEQRGEGVEWADSSRAAFRVASGITADPSARLRLQAWEARYFGGDEDAAIARLREAAETRPSDVAVVQTLANLYSLRGRLSESARWYRQAALLDPLQASPWLGLFQKYMEVGLYERAEQALHRALAADPGLAAIRNGFVWLRTMQGRFQEALTAVDSAEALGEPYAPGMRGLVHYWAGDVGKAHAVYASVDLSEMPRTGHRLLVPMAHVRFALGDSAGGRRIVQRVRRGLESRRVDNPSLRLALAAVEADTAQAIRSLREHVERGGRDYHRYVQDPLFEDLRAVPGFRAELADLGRMVKASRRQILRELSGDP